MATKISRKRLRYLIKSKETVPQGQLLVCPTCGRYPVYPEGELRDGLVTSIIYRCADCRGRFIWKDGRWQPYTR